MSVLTNPVLTLNKSWLPHDSTIVGDAFGVVCSERAVFLEADSNSPDPDSYGRHNLNSWCKLPVQDSSAFIQLTNGRIRAPEIMLLTDFNKIPDRKVVFCRRNLWRRDKRRCQFCGKEPCGDDITMDHIHPKSKGGESIFENCVLCCTECNLKKGNKSLAQAGMRLRRMKKLPNGEWSVVFYDRPQIPRWNPLYALRRKTYPKSWAAFLKSFDETLYWEVELET